MRHARAFVALCLLAACDGGSPCVDGMSVACACSDGTMGAQVCREGRYEPCVCDGVPGDGGHRDGGTALDGSARDASSGDASTHDGSVIGPDGSVGCAAGATRCGASGLERCADGAWVADVTCALGCADGACATGPAMCEPGATRCYRSSVQRCNRDGSAWLHDAICDGTCEAGLCVGACTTGEARCVDDRREVCSGGSFVADATCSLGCEARVCVEPELSLPGTVVELSGTHVYTGCVDVDLGGELRVPAGATLEVWARCLRVSASSRITIGTGATLRIRVTETANVAGSVSGGEEAFVESRGSLTLAGSVSSRRTILRADALTIAAGGSTAGTSLNAALYGRAFMNGGSHSGIVSVMPPTPIESPTHPSAGVWNLAGDDVVVAWSRPFETVRGYYVVVGDAVPGPGAGSFTTTESVALPASSFGPGDNRVRVVSVNADSEVGAFAEELVVRLNVRAPTIQSTSHPDEEAWGGVDDVFLSWSDPSGVPASTFAGYFYLWDRQADTVPDAGRGTFDDRRMLLLNDQPPGIWFFHLVSIDRLGRTSTVAHRQVRIGPDPGSGNVAGTVTDASTGMPIDRATVLLDGGLLRAYTDATGDYTFRGTVPASAEPQRITVRARGYETAEATALVEPGGAVVRHFMLTPSGAAPGPVVRLGWELPLASTVSNEPSVAMGPSGRFVWAQVAASGSPERVDLVRRTGEPIHGEPTLREYYDYPRTEVGWNGERFHAVDVYQCGYDAAMSFGHGWSCLQMRTWDPTGTVTGGWRRWRNSGQTGSPSVAWNGTSYGTFFISYTALYHRELTPDLAFADGGDATTHQALSTGHYDSRQLAGTRAIWDGSGYAVAWNIGRSTSDGNYALFFGRWSRTLAVLQARIEVDTTRSSSEVGLVFDGARYHLAYARWNAAASRYELTLRTVSSTGTLGERTLVRVAGGRSPSLAFDGRHLFLAWEDPSGESSHLEVRRTSDHEIVESYVLPGRRPRVDVSATTGEGVVLYQRDGATYVRTLDAD